MDLWLALGMGLSLLACSEVVLLLVGKSDTGTGLAGGCEAAGVQHGIGLVGN